MNFHEGKGHISVKYDNDFWQKARNFNICL